jgi:hypothetical protein
MLIEGVMNSLICKAIAERKTLLFRYKNVGRWVEPHCYGRQHNGKDGLLAWQLAGGSAVDYREFLSDQMESISLGNSFDGPREKYSRSDPRFSFIYMEL